MWVFLKKIFTLIDMVGYLKEPSAHTNMHFPPPGLCGPKNKR